MPINFHYKSSEHPWQGALQILQVGNFWTAGWLATRKKDRKNHGFGLETVEQIVEKYQGTLELRPEGECFIANCVLQKRD